MPYGSRPERLHYRGNDASVEYHDHGCVDVSKWDKQLIPDNLLAPDRPIQPIDRPAAEMVREAWQSLFEATDIFAEGYEMNHTIRDVEILYPRINQPYRFDPSAGENGKSVPCDAFADQARYELSFRMTHEQAEELWRAMSDVYTTERKTDWPEKLGMTFEEDTDTKTFIGKSVLKAAYDKEATRKPGQFDAHNNRLPDDFLLTTGSRGNLAVEFVPYCMKNQGVVASYGVSLRLRAVQVTEYRPMEDQSPFEPTEGFAAEPENPFAETEQANQQASDAAFEAQNPLPEDPTIPF